MYWAAAAVGTFPFVSHPPVMSMPFAPLFARRNAICSSLSCELAGIRRESSMPLQCLQFNWHLLPVSDMEGKLFDVMKMLSFLPDFSMDCCLDLRIRFRMAGSSVSMSGFRLLISGRCCCSYDSTACMMDVVKSSGAVPGAVTLSDSYTDRTAKSMESEVALAPFRDCAICSIAVSGNRKKSPENAMSSIWLPSNLTNERMRPPLDLCLPSLYPS